jgi:hypothetical protein
LTANEGRGFAQDLQDIGVKANRSGATLAAFQQQSKTLAEEWSRLKAEITVALIEIGKTLRPIVTEMIEKVQSWLSWWRGLSEETKRGYLELVAWVAAAGPIIYIIGKLIVLGGTLATVIRGIGVALAFVAANPIVLIIAGVVAIGAAVYKLIDHYNDLEQSQRDLVKTCEQMRASYESTTDSLAEAMGAASKLFAEIEATPDAELPTEVLDSYIALQDQIQKTYQAKLALEEAMKPGSDLADAQAALAAYNEEMEKTASVQKSVEDAMNLAKVKPADFKPAAWKAGEKDIEAQMKYQDKLNEALREEMGFEDKMTSLKTQQADLEAKMAKEQARSVAFYNLKEKSLENELAMREAIQAQADKVREDAQKEVEIAKTSVGAASMGSVEAYKFSVKAQQNQSTEKINKAMDEKLADLVKLAKEQLVQLTAKPGSAEAVVVTIAP